MAHRRKVAERLEPYFAKTGIEVNKINQILAQSETNLRRAVNQRATRTKKLLAADKNRFRRISRCKTPGLRAADKRGTAPFPGFCSHQAHTFFDLVPAARHVIRLWGIEPFANFAKIRFDLASDDEFSGAQQLSFYFLWENQNDNVAVLGRRIPPLCSTGFAPCGQIQVLSAEIAICSNAGVTWLGPVANDRVVFAARCGNARHRVFRRGRRRILGR